MGQKPVLTMASYACNRHHRWRTQAKSHVDQKKEERKLVLTMVSTYACPALVPGVFFLSRRHPWKRIWPLFTLTFLVQTPPAAPVVADESESGHCFHLLFWPRRRPWKRSWPFCFVFFLSTCIAFHPLREYSGSQYFVCRHIIA